MGLIALLACIEDPCQAPGDAAAPISPSPGVTLTTSPWVPVLLTDVPDAPLRTCLDGQATSLDLVVRARYPALGGGTDAIGLLELGALGDGPHTLSTFAGDQAWSSTFTLDRPPNRVEIQVDDGTAPVPARVVVLDGQGQPVELASPDAPAADPRGRDATLNTTFARDGVVALYLPDGDYRFLAMRGVREEIDSVSVRVDGDRVVELSTPRVIHDRVTADFHVHTARSPDAFLPDEVRVQSLLAAALDIAVVSEHATVGDFAGPDGVLVVPGVERGLRRPDEGTGRTFIGHINAYPVQPQDTLPPLDVNGLQDHITEWRQTVAPRILQLNHPRGIQFRPDGPVSWTLHALFTDRFHRDRPLTHPDNAWLIEPSDQGITALDFDTVEVMNRASRATFNEARLDWFALMNQGWFLTGVGNSDSHAQQLEPVGFPTNLVACEVDLDCVLEALDQGRVTATTGPVVDLDVQGQTVTATVRTASWIPAHEARLVVNGQVAQTEPLPSGPLDVQLQWDLDLDQDAWVLVEAGWAPDQDPGDLGDYALVLPGFVPMAFTNAVRIDADNDGVWTPPGLP